MSQDLDNPPVTSSRPEPSALPDRPIPGELFDRRFRECQEELGLASYALRSRLSEGRKYPEEGDDLRTCWERDRDRIVHCTAFRRLMYKTQVFVNREGDHNRTRLSHSLEVSQVARSVANALGLNEAFCEALALAHDIGHPPFGHRGEWALDKAMKEHGGFRHNQQVLRVVDLLERRSPEYPGLNLTRELRESFLKHEANADWPDEFRPRRPRPFLEAQVVDLADSTAYNVHDLEDGLLAEILDEGELEREVALWRGAREAVELRHPRFLTRSRDRNLRVKRITNEVLKICINDLISASAKRLARAKPKSPGDVRDRKALLVAYSPPIKREVAEPHRFLFRRFYRHPHLLEMTKFAKRVISGLFSALLERPAEMPIWYRKWAKKVGRERAVCDYIAGMTDRFAEGEYERLSRLPRRR